jgi:hypothetical protein
MRFLHRYPNSSLDVMRELGIDARGAARRRRELLMRKWEGEPRIADGLDFLRGLAVV